MTLHSFTECGWMKSTGDIIHANYDKDVNFALNRTKSYCELTNCRCLPSWSLLSHGNLMD